MSGCDAAAERMDMMIMEEATFSFITLITDCLYVGENPTRLRQRAKCNCICGF